MTKANEQFKNLQNKLKEVSKLAGFSESFYNIIKEPERTIEVNIPVKMDDGRTETFRAYRSAHSTALGPAKGGVRFDESVSYEEVKVLSTLMSLKVALHNLPLGGGKGGIAVNPFELSERELESLSRGFVRAINNYLGPRTDIPAPDVNTNAKIMGYFTDEYIALNEGRHDIAAFTGKAVEMGGSLGRGPATGFGVYLTIKKYYEKIGKSLEGASFAIQGFGNVGSSTAKYLMEDGAKLVAINSKDTNPPYEAFTVLNEEGFDIEEVIKAKEETGSELNVGGKKLSTEEFFALDVDILIPAALGNVIDETNADSIRADLVVEAANGPVTEAGEAIINKKNIPLIPDILANSGGVLVSHYEWIQNITGSKWDEDYVREKQEKDMAKAIEEVFETADKYQVNYRKAAFILSLSRIEKALELRGRI
ncbi:Glu/Leu/Phe/Val dehydrogenase [uncultured Anaerococcus sp.]|uniref:Glu/Leu/Phe/Val family dehydrogenase n=1 Tax=uncultured Anaerococcus sp. TaxID=293428 RepID=UPI0025D9090C|nr:Glu/Leu/Phe/Val dehydrogenase [uncultured Anaerococcus sp.]